MFTEIPFGKILSSIGEGVVLFDSGGLITYLNPHASLLLDYTASEILGEKVDEVFNISIGGSKISQSIYNTVVVSRVPFNSISFQYTLFLTSKGRTFPVSIIATPIFIKEKVMGGIVVFRDISLEEKKRLELAESNEHIKQLNDQLTKKIEELNSLNRVNV